MRGDALQDTPVLITTRPWRAESLTSVESINKQYLRVRVEGFKKRDVELYISKFFEGDTQSAKSLIHFMTDDSLVETTTRINRPTPVCSLYKTENIA